MANYCISLGYAKKDENGDYYDVIPKKIFELTPKKLVILDKENRRSVYKKTN